MLLIFIRGPGGSHLLKEGCQAQLGTLCPSPASRRAAQSTVQSREVVSMGVGES